MAKKTHVKRQDHYRNIIEYIIEIFHGVELNPSINAEVLLPDVKMDMLFEIPQDKISNPKSPFAQVLQEVNIFHIKAFNDHLTKDDVKQYIGELYVTAVSSLCKNTGKIGATDRKSIALTIFSAEAVAKNIVSGLYSLENTNVPWIYKIVGPLDIAYLFVIDEVPEDNEYYHLFMPFRSYRKLKTEHDKIFQISRNITHNQENLLAIFWLNKLQPAIYEELNMTVDMEEIIEQLCPESLKKVEQRGVIKGRAEGRAEGLTEGRAEGRTEGRTEGITQGQIECAKRFLKQGLDIPTVAKGTGLSEEKVASLQKIDNAN